MLHLAAPAAGLGHLASAQQNMLSFGTRARACVRWMALQHWLSAWRWQGHSTPPICTCWCHYSTKHSARHDPQPKATSHSAGWRTSSCPQWGHVNVIAYPRSTYSTTGAEDRQWPTG